MKKWLVWVDINGSVDVGCALNTENDAYTWVKAYGNSFDKVLGITEVEVPQPKIKRVEKRWSTKNQLSASCPCPCPWMLPDPEFIKSMMPGKEPIEVTLTWEE